MKSPISGLNLDQNEATELRQRLQLRVNCETTMRSLATAKADDLEACERLVERAGQMKVAWVDLLPARLQGSVRQQNPTPTAPAAVLTTATPRPAAIATPIAATGATIRAEQDAPELTDAQIRESSDPRAAYLHREVRLRAMAAGATLRRIGSNGFVASTACGDDVTSFFPRTIQQSAGEPTGIAARYQAITDPAEKCAFLRRHEAELRALVA